jgi:hypothetical protein
VARFMPRCLATEAPQSVKTRPFARPGHQAPRPLRSLEGEAGHWPPRRSLSGTSGELSPHCSYEATSCIRTARFVRIDCAAGDLTYTGR